MNSIEYVRVWALFCACLCCKVQTPSAKIYSNRVKLHLCCLLPELWPALCAPGAQRILHQLTRCKHKEKIFKSRDRSAGLISQSARMQDETAGCLQSDDKKEGKASQFNFYIMSLPVTG